MFPNLSYILNYFFGTPVDNSWAVVQTFGLFMILAFLASGFLVYWELRRMRKQGLFQGEAYIEVTPSGIRIDELLAAGTTSFILGWKLPYICKQLSNNEPFTLFSWSGNFWIGILFSILIVGFLYLRQRKTIGLANTEIPKMRYPEHHVFRIIVLAVVFGLAGSKLFSIFENWQAFLQAPIQQLFASGGLTIYGGLLFAALVIIIYLRRKNIPLLAVMDASAPALMMGYLIGRMGCHFSGDGDWGIVNTAPKPSWFVLPDWAWAYQYPHNVVNDMSTGVAVPDCGGLFTATGEAVQYCSMLAEPVFPTPIYEILACLFFFLILWFCRTRFKRAGLLFFLYLCFNGIERFCIEQIRINPRYDILGFSWSMSQCIALVLLLIGVLGMVVLMRRERKL